MNLKGRVRVINKKHSATNKPNRQTIQNVVKREINRALRAIDGKLSAQRVGIRRDLRRELFSPRFGKFIGNSVTNAGNDSFRDIAEEYVNKAVAVATTAGPVSGTLIRVGDNFMAVQETPNTILVIPFNSVTAIRQL
jgi:hypothetical protein